ncbi:2-hydroxy-acid oxidase (plasmid) [Sulfitobacter sp. SK012]|uniref:FAD-binding oxidoreductase n=1 Tax=Sulfitobacter sp. SK012 TaxID=1389005 RepID=UPI000E0A1B70|nr:FAD-linked oxidase C-terminal domain-containing protein [Sulfitobacter sp. SK012]AXI49251.1 2-hydroxy-acid oxidase [Sulfitobacter sp. SK012]
MSESPFATTVDALRALLGDRLSTGSSILEMHGRDEAYTAPALPDAVAFPETTQEVSDIVKICAKSGCPVIPFGVGTSLEGHIIPIHGGISIDTSRMNNILEVHEQDLNAVVQPGVTRTQLNEELRATGLMFTVDPGADATMGGMAATRASGTNSVRYGTMRENVLALEVVLPDGQIIKTGSQARKSASGYDLTHLIIGSEGTLGIITKLTVRLFGQPETILSATCAFETIGGAVDAVILAIQSGIPLARVELLDDVQMKGMNIHNLDMNLPEKPHLFLEFHGSEAGAAEQVGMFRDISDEFGGSDFQWATKAEDRNKLWKARHEAYYAAKALRPGSDGFVTDCCVPISKLAECIARTKKEIEKSGLIAPILGHVGDGNFHLVILIESGNVAELKAAETLAEAVNLLALELGGTVTGEHGVGVGKKKYMKSEHGAAYSLMSTIKRAIDPQNIMNPGKTVTID